MRVIFTIDGERDLDGVLYRRTVETDSEDGEPEGLSLGTLDTTADMMIRSDYNSELAEIRNRYPLQNDIMVYCFEKSETDAITQLKDKVKERQEYEKSEFAEDNEAYRIEKGQTIEEAEKEEQEYYAGRVDLFKSANINTPADILWAMCYGYGDFGTETSPRATVEEISHEGIVNNMKKHGYPTLGDAAIPHAYEPITSYEIITWHDNYDELWCETENHCFYFYCFYS